MKAGSPDVPARQLVPSARGLAAALYVVVTAALSAGCVDAADVSVGSFHGGRFLFATTGTNAQVESYRRDASSGALTFIEAVDGGTEPRHLAVHHNTRLLYVARTGIPDVAGFRINPDTGVLTELGVTAPCSFDLAIHPSFSLLYCTSDAPGIQQYQISPASGVLVDMGVESQGNVIAGVVVTPDGRFLYAPDSADDLVYGFVLDPATGLISGTTPTPSIGTDTGPFIAAIDPFSRFLYVANIAADTVTAYTIAANGNLAAAGSVSATGPQSLTVDTSGTVLYVMATGDNEVRVYDIDQGDGSLTQTGSIGRPIAPIGLAVLPESKLLYAGQELGPGIGLYRIGGGGALTLVDDYPGANGGQIWGILPVDVH